MRSLGLSCLILSSCVVYPLSILTESECHNSLAKTAAACRAEHRHFSITDFVHGDRFTSGPAQPQNARFDKDAYNALNWSHPGLHAIDAVHNVYVVENFISVADRREIVRSVHEFTGSVQQGIASARRPFSFLQQAQSNCDSQMRRSSRCANMVVRKSEKAKIVNSTMRLLEKTVRPQIAALLPGLLRNHCFEPFQITKYEPGDYYSRHLDGRRATVLVFLGAGDQDNATATDGGCTYFPRLDLRVEPHPGRALIFFPTYGNGTWKPEMLHAAEEVTSGRKYIIQQWIDLPDQFLHIIESAGAKADQVKQLERRSCIDATLPIL